MSSLSNLCMLVVSLFAFIGDVVVSEHCSSTFPCKNSTQVCSNNICESCHSVCDPSSKSFSKVTCFKSCPGYVVPTERPNVSDKIQDEDSSKIQGTHVVATFVLETENTSANLEVRENGESIGTVLSLGDLAAICGAIAFIIFCIGLRILTKEYPCPWFVTPKNTKPIKLDENGSDELAELNV
ncbi:uncharacterized protein LOC117108684 isoform X2 [Anneissia japonica]|uniref:uncharacterized protein LOC117108684 isoform X2 n=1 Tax=Anneissia japonica TaxID=1529436 RepID=UPI0014256816|nr:uncharacterized protein LOC117108684 isoform X2 [Anneissia japonica]